MDIENWTPKDKKEKICIDSIILRHREMVKLMVKCIGQDKEELSNLFVMDKEHNFAIGKGFLILTDRRLIFLREQGLISKSYDIVEECDYENIIKISIIGLLSKYISVVDKKKKDWRFAMKSKEHSNKDVLHTINELIKKRLETIEVGKQKEQAPQPIVNNIIKEEKMPKKRKGIKACPSCGGVLSELNYFKLKSGTDTKCDFCNYFISSGG